MYKISQSIKSHDSDVRSVFIDSSISFQSCSRDFTAKRYLLKDNKYDEIYSTCVHPKYISAVFFIQPNDEYPTGLFYTGCYDGNIRVFQLTSQEPFFSLQGHVEAVTCLSGDKDLLISGSLDFTAIIWENFTRKFTLIGHKQAVWSVAIYKSFFLTASADKTIKMWQNDVQIRTFEGHTDCVRGVAVNTAFDAFLTCSNDGTVRCWHPDCSDPLETFTGHTNYVYSVNYLKSDLEYNSFVSAGEDRTFRVWRKGSCVSSTVLPAQSVWTVDSSENGDIITGSSDGKIRVFSVDEARFGGQAMEDEFNAEVAGSSIPMQVGDLDSEDIHGLESLQQRGDHEGEMKMVRTEDGAVTVFSWSDCKWNKVGKVKDASTRANHKGKNYDYVFDVELEELPDGGLKLPYNRSETVEFAAQRFILENELPAFYYDQIVEFLVTNTKQTSLGREKPRFEPLKTYFTYSSLQLTGLTNKLTEFSQFVTEGEQLTMTELEVILNVNRSADGMDQILRKLIYWPAEMIFPVVDLFRFMVITHSLEMCTILFCFSEVDFAGFLAEWYRKCIKCRIPVIKLISNGLACEMSRCFFLKVFVRLRLLFTEIVGGSFDNHLANSFLVPFSNLLANIAISCNNCGESIEGVEEDALNLTVGLLHAYVGLSDFDVKNTTSLLSVLGTILAGNPRICREAISFQKLDDLFKSVKEKTGNYEIIGLTESIIDSARHYI